MRQIRKCDLCEEKEFKHLFSGQDKLLGLPKTFNVWQCKNCGLVFINPQPSKKELQKYYPPNYFAYEQKKRFLLGADLLLSRIFFGKTNTLWQIPFLPLRFFIRTTKIVPKGKILDIGCGNGEFLEKMGLLGMECFGVEPFYYNANTAKKHGSKVLNGELLQTKYPRNYFDVITVNHSFEHFDKPTKSLKEICRILKPNGTLIITVPNIESFARELLGSNWLGFDIPRHLFGYSDKTILQYAKKFNFWVESIRTEPVAFSNLLYKAYKTITRHGHLKTGHGKKGVLEKIFFGVYLLLNLFSPRDCVEIILTK